MTVVVVAEKPSVGRDLAAVLGATQRGEGLLVGNGYVVTWAIGHLVGLAEPEGIQPEWGRWRRADLPMLPKSWPLTVFSSTRRQFEIVRRAINDSKATSVVCATDAGREGELIFRLIYDAAGCRKPVQRLWVSSLTESAIRAGFRALRPASDFDALADAAMGRSRADWLVGMNLSRAYGLALDMPLSVGRVQTPTLAMLVERELAIRDFVPEDFLEVVATFSPRPGSAYKGTWFRPEGGERPSRLKASGEEAAAIVERALAGEAQVESVQSQLKKMPPPLLYDLTELQRHANRLYGHSAQQTLELAQRLYETHKLISYPRTSSRHLSTEVAATLPAIIEVIRGPYERLLHQDTGARPLTRRFVDDAQVSDHHAILPTAVAASSRALNAGERQIYELVCRRLLQAWHDDFAWAATSVVTAVVQRPPGQLVDRYRSHGTMIEHLGWKALDPGEARAPGVPGEHETMLPAGLEKGQKQEVLEAKAVPKRTRPPPRFNDAMLLTAMETAGKTLDEKELSIAMRDSGLGTPATRASIIETLLSREYVRRDGKVLHATQRGIGLIATVDPEVKSAAMTGEWEARLQRIARGSGQLSEFVSRVEKYVESVIGRVPPRLPPFGGAGPPPVAPGSAHGGSDRRGGVSTSEPAGSNARPAHTQDGGVSTWRAHPGNTIRGPANGFDTPRSGPRLANASHAATPSLRDSSMRELSETANGHETPHSPSRAANASHAAMPSVRAHHTRGLAGATNSAVPFGRPAAGASFESEPVAQTAVLDTLLRERFGFDTFRPKQRAVCEATLAGHDALLVMPTGAGKSLCYQLPGIARGGTTLVISPLIALIEDQVARLQSLGLRAERIHSGRGRVDSRGVCAAYLAGELDYLFIAPERLGVAGFSQLLARRPLALIAIDEAHCISQWGHDFRPDYRLLRERLTLLRPAPVIALTATATPIVQQDIIDQLGLGTSAKRFIHGFRRDNLAIEALEVPPNQRAEQTLRWLGLPGRTPAIVYAPTRKMAENVAELLSDAHRAEAYHAGLSAERRGTVQSAFLGGSLDVVVATVAFGMGIDKADVRTVVHLAMPSSIESYYQEIGRAGRDGKESRAVLMHHFADRKTHEFFLGRDYPDAIVLAKIFKALGPEPQTAEAVRKRTRVKIDDFETALDKLWVHGGARGVAEDQLQRGHSQWEQPYAEQRARRAESLDLVAKYAAGHQCRMVALIRHFGDCADSGQACGRCDVCAPADCIGAATSAPSPEEVELLEQLLVLVRLKPGNTSGQLCRDLLGELPSARPQFERLVSGLVRHGLLFVKDDAFEKDGRTVSFHRVFPTSTAARGAEGVVLPILLEPFTRRKKTKGGTRSGRKAKPTRSASSKPPVELPTSGHHAALVEKLRHWRLAEARRKRVPAFRVLTNRALVALAEARPQTGDALRRVTGIGPKLVQAYQSELLTLCAS